MPQSCRKPFQASIVFIQIQKKRCINIPLMATKLHIHIAHPAYHQPDRPQASMMNPAIAFVLLVDTNPAIFLY